MKLVIEEEESGALSQTLRGPVAVVSAGLLKVEAVRIAALAGQDAVREARLQLDFVSLIALTDEILEDASILPAQPRLRALDAIHVAAARALGPDLEAIVTYDQRMTTAAESLGLSVLSPRP